MNPTHSEILASARRVLSIENDGLTLAMRRLESGRAADDFARAVEMVVACRGRVVVTGLGKSGAIGRKIASTLASTGTPALFVHAAEALHGDLGMVAPGDVLLAISYSGRSDEIMSFSTWCAPLKCRFWRSPAAAKIALATHADLVLETGVESEACPLNLAPTASTTVTLALGDALAVCAMEIRGFGASDFARFHPGGALGRGLSLKVRDLMRVGERMAICDEGKSVRFALETITEARAGAAMIVDETGVLRGYLTDGDVRRQLLKSENPLALLEQNVALLMTRSPLALSGEMAALEARRLLQERRVDDAPVVDDDQKPIGWLDESELLRAGIF